MIAKNKFMIKMNTQIQSIAKNIGHIVKIAVRSLAKMKEILLLIQIYVSTTAKNVKLVEIPFMIKKKTIQSIAKHIGHIAKNVV